MNEELNQIVVQINAEGVPLVRALAQYGKPFDGQRQAEIEYDNLTAAEKKIFDSFITMIKSK